MTKVYTTVPCPVCGLRTDVDLDPEDVHAWYGGKLIQDVWPDMTASEREPMITAFTPSAFPGKDTA